LVQLPQVWAGIGAQLPGQAEADPFVLPQRVGRAPVEPQRLDEVTRGPFVEQVLRVELRQHVRVPPAPQPDLVAAEQRPPPVPPQAARGGLPDRNVRPGRSSSTTRTSRWRACPTSTCLPPASTSNPPSSRNSTTARPSPDLSSASGLPRTRFAEGFPRIRPRL